MKNRGRPVKANKLNTGIGALIANERVKLGYSQAKLGSLLGISLQFVSNIERGRAPLPWHLLHTVANTLSLDVNELIDANFSSTSTFKKMGAVIDTLVS